MKWREKITFGMLIVSMLFSTAVLGRNLWMQEKEQIKFEILRNRISAERERISAIPIIPIEPAKEVRMVLAFLVRRLLKLSDSEVRKDMEDFPIVSCLGGSSPSSLTA